MPHTRTEMMANAPRVIVKVTGIAVIQSIKNSTQAKINSWDNMPFAEKDVHEEAAKKVSVMKLRKALQSYHSEDSARCLRNLHRNRQDA